MTATLIPVKGNDGVTYFFPIDSVPVFSTALEASHVLKATPGTLSALEIITSSAAGYLMLFDANAAPADGAVTPVKCFQIPANSQMGFAWTDPLKFATGIVVVFSTTGPLNKTGSATAWFSGDVQ